MLDYGGKNSRQSGNRQFQFLELINMNEACGRDNEGQSKYNVALRLVDLDAIPQKEQERAKKSCGWEGAEDSDIALAEMCDSYGLHAPLGSWNGNNARQLLRSAYREANSLLDSAALESKLERPVNRIGSTAREFMAGNFTSASLRPSPPTKKGNMRTTKETPPPLRQIEMTEADIEFAERIAKRLGYTQTAYTSTSELWGLYCLPDHAKHRHGVIIKTAGLGFLFVADLEDLQLHELREEECETNRAQFNDAMAKAKVEA